ncbi:MAG TPA: cytochrome c-type biogenesis protein [Aestuariivirgaceae bacterium]|nr:cytochrome c-type biogenesis protein [Aestuariivirgaceae bacterium]
MRKLAALLIVLVLGAGPALGVLSPDDMLDDPALEARARALSVQVRCLVCQNQSIDDSDAALARDLRLLVRERLVAGDSDSQVLDFLVARYGEFVLMRPVLAPHTVLLWASPLLLLGLGALGLVVWFVRRRRLAAVDPLNDQERRELARILDEQAHAGLD